MRNKFLYWSPRILSILFVLFLSLFALDVFNEYQGTMILPALFLHLLIPMIVLATAMLAWKWELIGVIAFLFFGFYYIWSIGLNEHWSLYALMSGPAIVTGILFLLSWLQKRNKNKDSTGVAKIPQ